jgi:hypothetical protein
MFRVRRYDTYYSADKYEIVLAKQHKFYLQLFDGFSDEQPGRIPVILLDSGE